MDKEIKGKEKIYIFTCCNDYYIPYLSVLINSICKNVSEKYDYEIIIAEYGIDINLKHEIYSMKTRENVRVHFKNVEQYFNKEIDDWKIGRWCKEIYLTILAPYIFEDYDKIIYMDCDVINLCDLAELYAIDLGDKYVGASRLLGRCCMEENGFETKQVLRYQNDKKILQLSDYFNNGIMLLNLKKIREIYSLEFLIELICRNNFELLDQDCINYLCKNHVLYIDAGWNWYPYTDEEFSNVMSLCPDRYREYFWNGKIDQRNIHYTIPIKPWLEPFGTYHQAALLFWENAVGTPFYEQIVEQMYYYQDKKYIVSKFERKDFKNLENDICGKKVFLYGLGNKGKEFLKYNNLEISGIIDEDKSKWGVYCGIRVLGIDEIIKKEDTDNILLIISNANYENILINLLSKGIRNLYLAECIEKKGYFINSEEYFYVNQVDNLFEDEKSKIIYRKIINKRLNYIYDKNVKCLDIYEGNMYLNNNLLKDYNKGFFGTVHFDSKNYREIKCIKDGTVAFVDISCKGTDMWEIPIYISKHLKNYSIHIRQHASFLSGGTVLYVIPKKCSHNER